VQLEVRPWSEVCFSNQQNVNIITFYKELKVFVDKSIVVPHTIVEADLTHGYASLAGRNSSNAWGVLGETCGNSFEAIRIIDTII